MDRLPTGMDAATAALVEWREFFRDVTDEYERARIYAEMTGAFAQTNPTNFVEFVRRQVAVIENRKADIG